VRQARTVWLPAAAGGTGVAATVDRVNLKLLARALGDDVAAEVSGALPAPAPVGTAGADPSLLLVLAEHRADPAAPPGTLEAWLEPVLSRPDPAAAIRVAWLSAAADVLDRPDLRARARTVLTRLGAGRGVYAATIGGKPSLTASVIAAGVAAPAESSEDLVAAGLCDRSGCAEEPGPAGGWSLRPLAYYLRTPFPVAF
jgi:hypothetical protein